MKGRKDHEAARGLLTPRTGHRETDEVNETVSRPRLPPVTISMTSSVGCLRQPRPLASGDPVRVIVRLQFLHVRLRASCCRELLSARRPPGEQHESDAGPHNQPSLADEAHRGAHAERQSDRDAELIDANSSIPIRPGTILKKIEVTRLTVSMTNAAAANEPIAATSGPTVDKRVTMIHDSTKLNA